MHDLMVLELAKQRREEMTQQAEQDRLARMARGPRKRWDLVWELKRTVGLFRKLLRFP